MNSEKAAMMSVEPFINKFILTVVKTIRAQNLKHAKPQVIHADLVPKVSEKVMKASMAERSIPAAVKIEEPKIPKHQHREMEKLIAPIRRPPVWRHKPLHMAPPAKPAQMRPAQPMPQPAPGAETAVPQQPTQLNRPMDVAPVSVQVTEIPEEVQLSHDYGKITPLLNDPSVSSIECQGKDKPVMIIRAGQRQTTRIVLNEDDIHGILQNVSDTIHIPLLEGVFRAAADNFSINAVISEMIGSRFVIKKQTPYAMLEKPY